MPENELGGHHDNVMSTPETKEVAPGISARWQRVADRLARSAWLILLVAITLGLVGSLVYAVTWQAGTAAARVEVDECQSPPCFGGGGIPDVRDLSIVIPTLGYLLVIVLGLPSLLVGAWDLLRGRRLPGGQRLLAFVGPVLVFVGIEIIPHLLNPCFLVLQFGGTRLPELYCAYSPEWGADFADRWHALDHTLVGAVPLAALYGWALRRWHPSIASLRRPRGARAR